MIEFTFFKTQVRIRPVFFANIFVLWAIATIIGLWGHPGRPLHLAIIIGFGVMLMFMIADLGHAIAHIFSAQRADAPMDEIHITSGMPRTIYFDNQVSPDAHRIRSLGGPIFSLTWLILSMALYFIFPPGNVVHELAGWAIIGHAFIFFGAMLPLPVVDGGVLYKWTLVINGKTEEEADLIIRRANWVVGIIGVLISIFFLLLKSWIIAAVFMMIGLTTISFAARKPIPPRD